MTQDDAPQENSSSPSQPEESLHFQIHTLTLAPLSISAAPDCTMRHFYSSLEQRLQQHNYYVILVHKQQQKEKESLHADSDQEQTTGLPPVRLFYLEKEISTSDAGSTPLQEYFSKLSVPLSYLQQEPIPLYVHSERSNALLQQILDFVGDSQVDTVSIEEEYLGRKFLHALAAELCLHHQSKKSKSNPLQKFVQIKKGKKFYRWKKDPSQEKINRRITLHRAPKNRIAVSQILPWLYLGSGRDLEEMHDVERVLNCTSDWSTPLNLHPSVEYKRLNLLDQHGVDIRAHFEEAHEFIEQSANDQKKLLIHCVIGKSRSASIVISYLMKKNNWSLKKAHDFVLEKRSIIRPNNDFLAQLQEYEMDLHEVEQPSLYKHQLNKPKYLEQRGGKKKRIRREDPQEQQILRIVQQELFPKEKAQDIFREIGFNITDITQIRDLLPVIQAYVEGVYQKQYGNEQQGEGVQPSVRANPTPFNEDRLTPHEDGDGATSSSPTNQNSSRFDNKLFVRLGTRHVKNLFLEKLKSQQ